MERRLIFGRYNLDDLNDGYQSRYVVDLHGDAIEVDFTVKDATPQGYSERGTYLLESGDDEGSSESGP